MSHPFIVDHLQKDHTLDLADLLRRREFRLLCLVKAGGRFLEHVLELVLFHPHLIFAQLYRL